jgi:hypothetical protein
MATYLANAGSKHLFTEEQKSLSEECPEWKPAAVTFLRGKNASRFISVLHNLQQAHVSYRRFAPKRVCTRRYLVCVVRLWYLSRTSSVGGIWEI